MRRLPPTAAIAAIAMASGLASEAAAGPPRRSTEAVARAVFERFNRHDLDGMAALYAEDAEIITPDQPHPLRGPAGIRAEHGPLFARFPDIRDRIVSLTVQGERAAVEFVSSGCGAPGAGCFELPIASVLTVRKGRIVRDATYFDVPDDAVPKGD